jgi:hypothetical protein
MRSWGLVYMGLHVFNPSTHKTKRHSKMAGPSRNGSQGIGVGGRAVVY